MDYNSQKAVRPGAHADWLLGPRLRPAPASRTRGGESRASVLPNRLPCGICAAGRLQWRPSQCPGWCGGS